MKISNAALVGIATGIVSGTITALTILLFQDNFEMKNDLKDKDDLICKLHQEINDLKQKV